MSVDNMNKHNSITRDNYDGHENDGNNNDTNNGRSDYKNKYSQNCTQRPSKIIDKIDR